MKDSKGNEIKLGMTVSVPEPNDSDSYGYEFIGTVDNFHGGYVIVVDQDNDAYAVEPERLTVIYDTDELVRVDREAVVKAMCDWLNEADAETLIRIYSENFDAPLQGYDAGLEQFVVSRDEAERVGMEILN